MSATGEAAARLEELRERTRAVTSILRKAEKVSQEVAEPLETAAREVERRLARKGASAVVVGSSPAATGALLDAVVGDRVFSPERPAGARTYVRSGVTYDFRATWRGGLVEEFGVPDRRDSFVKAVARAEQERLAAEEAVKTLTDRLAAIDEALALVVIAPPTEREPTPSDDAPSAPVPRGIGETLRAIWAWFLHLIGVLRPLPPATPEPPAADPAATTRVRSPDQTASLRTEREPLERQREGAHARVESAVARLLALRQERDDYAAARRRSFLDHLRALTDGTPRGAEIRELSIDLPAEQLPPGFSLFEARELLSSDPAEAERALVVLGPDIDAVVGVGADDAAAPAVHALLAALAPIPIHVWSGSSAADELTALFDRVGDGRLLAEAQRAVAIARRAIGRATDATGSVVTVVRERIAALEGQRIGDRSAYRAHLLERVAKPIEDTSRSMERDAVAVLRAGTEQMKSEWQATIEACTDRAAVEAAIVAINAGAAARLDLVIAEMQRVLLAAMQWASDAMKLELVEELEARYEIVRRASVVDGGPVVSSVTAEDFARIESPLTGAMSAFEDKRVGYGLGGAAAGALLGTLIVPGIGTAIGAFLGTFAGFLKGVDSLKRECVDKLDACLRDVVAQIQAQLEKRHGEFVDAIRRALDDALVLSLDRFERATTRILDLERGVLDREAKKLDELLSFAAAIDLHGERVTELARAPA